MTVSRRHALMALALGLALAPASLEAQSFTLTVPLRQPIASLPQTARVKIAFESAAIGPAPQVAIAGGASISPATDCVTNAASCNALGTFGPGGADVAQVKWVSSTKLEVTLTLNSDFAGNFCASTRVADRTLSVALTNVAATGYRMASYIVPELATADNPAPACSTAFRRASASRAFLSVVGGVSNLGRLPLDIVLVLDKSGSMGWSIPGAPGVQRFARLRAAVGQFMGLWKQAIAIGVEGSPDDRIGLVFFDSSAQDGILDAGSIFKKRGPTSTGWDDPAGDVVSAYLEPPPPQMTPGGATSLGGGIARAKLRWDALAASVPNDPTFVVFTDGEQNTPPCVLSAGETDASPCATSLTTPLQVQGTALRNYSVPILTIGLGANAGPFAELLDQISHETAGQSRIAADGVALDLGFADQLVGALKGNTLSLMARRVETLPANGPGQPLSVRADGSVKRVTFVLGWEGMRSPRAVALEIRKPDGALVTPVVTTGGDSYFVASVDIPGSGPVGVWQAQVVRTPATDGTIRYHLSGYAVEGRLDYRLSVKSAALGTGAPVVVAAELAYDGQPLADLPSGALRVVVERPGENLGTILSLADAVGTQQNEGGGATQPPVGAKIDALAGNEKLIDRITPQPLPNALVMQQVGPGIYEASFQQTVLGGQYRFRVEMDWDDPRTTRIQRSELLERQVPVLPTATATQVQVSWPDDSVAQIRITPRDRFGNYVGPGYAGLVQVQASPATVIGPVMEPALDGAYVVRLSGLAPGADPVVTVRYRGRTLRAAPLSKLSAPGNGLSVGLRLGAGVPHGSTGGSFDPGLSFDADLEYTFGSAFAVQALFGYDAFSDAGAGTLKILRFSANAKVYLGGGALRGFLNAGGGAYALDPGDTKAGANVGVGVEREITPRIGVEAAYNYHLVDTQDSTTKYSTFEAGIRIRF